MKKADNFPGNPPKMDSKYDNIPNTPVGVESVELNLDDLDAVSGGKNDEEWNAWAWKMKQFWLSVVGDKKCSNCNYPYAKSVSGYNVEWVYNCWRLRKIYCRHCKLYFCNCEGIW